MPLLRPVALVATVACTLSAVACSPAAKPGPPTSGSAAVAGSAPAPAPAPPSPASARSALAKGEGCGNVKVAPPADGGALVPCAFFPSPEDAVRAVLADRDPVVLAVGEAHAQRGTEAIASATKRFTTSLLPLLAPRASDVVVELWAPNPACRKEVQAVASAQKPVVTAQATSNVNEYETLGARSKALGVTPWLLRPTCDDFKAIESAGDGAVSVMLGLVKSLTSARVRQLLAKGAADGGTATPAKMVVAYGGMMHNDLLPPPATKDYSFAPDLVAASGGRYVELDLVVPEYVKPSPTWQALPWYPTHEVLAGAAGDRTTLYQTGERSFVLVFPRSSLAAAERGDAGAAGN